jgi:hypothetical protein
VLYLVVFCILQSLELFLEVKGVRHPRVAVVVVLVLEQARRVDHMSGRVMSHLVTPVSI